MARILRSKLVRTGIKYTCTAPMYLTEFNKQVNREVYKTCFQKPKFKPQVDCKSCNFCEVKDANKNTSTDRK